MLPIIIFCSVSVPIFLETKATPVRYFVLVDQSGTLAAAVEAALERDHQQRVLETLGDFARKNSAAPARPSARSRRPAASLAERAPVNLPSLDEFIAKGGKEA